MRVRKSKRQTGRNVADEGGGSELSIEEGGGGVVSEGEREDRGPPMVCDTKWLQLSRRCTCGLLSVKRLLVHKTQHMTFKHSRVNAHTH